MKSIITKLEGKKSYIISIVLFLYAVIVVGWQSGDWSQALELIFGSAGLSAIRAGIAKK